MARTNADMENASLVLRRDVLNIMLDRWAASPAASAAASADTAAASAATSTSASAARDLDFVELFAGDHAVSRGLRAFGYRGLTFDIRTIDPKHDILTPSGICGGFGRRQTASAERPAVRCPRLFDMGVHVQGKHGAWPGFGRSLEELAQRHGCQRHGCSGGGPLPLRGFGREPLRC